MAVVNRSLLFLARLALSERTAPVGWAPVAVVCLLALVVVMVVR
jgi:hypothetical protein